MFSNTQNHLPSNLEAEMQEKINRARKVKRSSKPSRRLTPTELRTIAFVATLTLAGIAIVNNIDSPVVWAFLGMAIGTAVGQPN